MKAWPKSRRPSAFTAWPRRGWSFPGTVPHALAPTATPTSSASEGNPHPIPTVSPLGSHRPRQFLSDRRGGGRCRRSDTARSADSRSTGGRPHVAGPAPQRRAHVADRAVGVERRDAQGPLQFLRGGSRDVAREQQVLLAEQGSVDGVIPEEGDRPAVGPDHLQHPDLGIQGQAHPAPDHVSYLAAPHSHARGHPGPGGGPPRPPRRGAAGRPPRPPRAPGGGEGGGGGPRPTMGSWTPLEGLNQNV